MRKPSPTFHFPITLLRSGNPLLSRHPRQTEKQIRSQGPEKWGPSVHLSCSFHSKISASARPSSPCVRSTSERFHYIISVLQIHPQSHGGSGCLTSHATVRRIGCPQTLGAAPSPPLCAASCPNSSRGDPDPGSAITRRPGPRLHPLSHEPLSGPPHTR